MKIFVTGASGWIGAATTAELLAAGHQVVGLARSDASAAAVEAAGAQVLRGDLDDLDSLRRGAENSDGVVHLGYNHDFSDMPGAAHTDGAAIAAMGEVLAGTDRLLLIASGTLGLATGRVATETDRPTEGIHPRLVNATTTLALAERGVRSVVVRFAPTVHGPGDHGFMARIVEIARERGVAAFVGDGGNRWPAVHRADAGRLVRLAVEQAPAGAVLHAVAEKGVPMRDVADAIGRGLELPTTTIPPEQAMAHFGWLGAFIGADVPASSDLTRAQLGWEPTHPTLLDELAAGVYFR